MIKDFRLIVRRVFDRARLGITFLSRAHKSFTLLEVLIIVAIIIALASIGLVLYNGVMSKIRDTKRMADIDAISKAYEVNRDPSTGKYRALTGNDFVNGSVPTSPDGQDYSNQVLAGGDDFYVCTGLESHNSSQITSSCTPANKSCACCLASGGCYGAQIAYVPSSPSPSPSPSPGGPLTIANITDNGSLGKYDKFEITFDVLNSLAENFFYPFDSAPPAGVVAGIGITVDAEISPDNFLTTYKVPAFYYQDFDYQVKSGRDWFYPKDVYKWKVRFAPPAEGTWKYRLKAQDASGSITSSTQNFTVTASSNKGFIRVSQADKRYFEYEGDGSYFPGLGYNMNYDNINWDSPIQNNQNKFQAMKNNGIQFIRHWISQWGIWNSWDVVWTSKVYGPDEAAVRVPYYIDSGGNRISLPASPRQGSDVAMMLQQYWQPCMGLGLHQKESPAVKGSTTYKIFIRYLLPKPLPAKLVAGSQGLVAKTGNWGGNNSPCDVNVGTTVTNYGDQISTQTWQIIEGSITTSANAINLGQFWLVFDNMDHSQDTPQDELRVFIDRVEIREDATGCAKATGEGADFDLSNGNCGINIVSRPYMDHHQYVDQKYSYALDKMLELSKQNDVYLKLVTLEKNEYIQNHIDYNGNTIRDNLSNCSGVNYDQANTTNGCPGNYLFHGDGRNVTKVRWLQQAWWRYLQARWGYSTNIHSWELLNEGSPGGTNGTLHFTQADELGKYMKQFIPNTHLITTSFFSQGFPTSSFFANSSYPNIDYANKHLYIAQNTNPTGYNDPASAVSLLSSQIGAKTAGGVNKPTTRGETGLTLSGTQPASPELSSDLAGIWLHKFVWAGINWGGVMESYFYEEEHIYPPGKDFRVEFKRYYDFISTLPLNNGNYADAQATPSDTNIRIMGQKDVINGKAHLWIDNKTQTWNNSTTLIPASGTVQFSGMSVGTYNITWYDTFSGTTTQGGTTSPVSGTITLTLPQSLDFSKGDIAVKVEKQ